MNLTQAEAYDKMKQTHLYDPENKYVGDGQILGAEEETGYNDGVDYNGDSLGFLSDTNYDGRYSYGRDIDGRTEEQSTLLRDQIYGIDTTEYARRYQEEAMADDTSPEYVNTGSKEDEVDDEEMDNSDDIDSWFDDDPDEDTWFGNPELENTAYELTSGKANQYEGSEEDLEEEQEEEQDM